MNDTDARRRNHWVSHIARHAHEKPGGLYLRFEGGSVTWAQIHERVSGLAAALRERGVRAGDRVAIMTVIRTALVCRAGEKAAADEKRKPRRRVERDRLDNARHDRHDSSQDG